MEEKLLDAKVYKAWLDSNPDKQGSDDYKAIEAAHLAAGGLSPEIEAVKEVVLDPKSGPMEKLGAMIPYVYYKGRDLVTSAGIRAAPAVVGQYLGQRYGGDLGGRAGAGAGALGGSIYDQLRTKGSVSAGETVADVGAAMVNPRGALKAGAVGAGAAATQQLIDEGQIDLSRVAQAGTTAGVLSAATKKAIPPKFEMAKPDDQYLYRYRAFQDVKNYGVKVNPAELERGSAAFNQFAGEDAMSVAAAKSNQNAWQSMVRQQAEMEVNPKKTNNKTLAFEPSTRKYGIEMDDGDLDKKIYEVAAPYRKIDEISKAVGEEIKLMAEQKLKNGKYVTSYVSPEGIDAMKGASANLKQLKEVRRQQKVELAKMDAGDPAAMDRFKALKDTESGLESKIEAAAVASGEPGLKDDMVTARKKIAVLKTIDNATETYGLVSPKKLFAQREAGVPITGNLEKIALFYDAFKPSGQEAVAAGLNKMPGTAANYTARNIMMKNVSGVLSGGFPFISEGARSYILREAAQESYSKPRMVMQPQGAGEMAARQASMALSRRVGDKRDKKK